MPAKRLSEKERWEYLRQRRRRGTIPKYMIAIETVLYIRSLRRIQIWRAADAFPYVSDYYNDFAYRTFPKPLPEDETATKSLRQAQRQRDYKRIYRDRAAEANLRPGG